MIIRLAADVPMGGYPTRIAVYPEGGRVYVADWETGQVKVLDRKSLPVTATVPVEQRPFGVAVHPSGDRA